ncbi:HCR1 [Candida theae]|uniref:Eukaryotic translation initiation factor 3 subunit J n=1 Tax=Candida theae TaxID=1198502 RepID=A0AAD5BGP0_9ASCO|nr:HCR1 [Candida theae]KAI5961934.1 HCR1 [Candida theae]
MAWDDEDFDIPSNSKTSASWEDEEDDDPLLESWDVDPEEEAKKKKAAKEAEAKAKAEQKAKEDEARKKKEKKRQEMEQFDNLDERSKRELLKKAELSADLNNAADLFGGLGVAGDGDGDDDDFDINEHPREKARRAEAAAAAAAASRKPVLTKDTPLEDHPLFQPTNKQEYEKLRKAVGTALTTLNEDSSLLYASSLAIDLIRDLTQPLSVENTRKVISTLNVIIKDKERQERLARLKKTGGTASGGAGKKKAKPAARPNVGGFKKDDFDDMGGDLDGLDDDDFM